MCFWACFHISVLAFWVCENRALVFLFQKPIHSLKASLYGIVVPKEIFGVVGPFSTAF